MTTSDKAVLRVQSLSVAYKGRLGLRTVVGDLSFDLTPNQILGLAGESGCGKSTLALSLAGYRPRGAVITGGSVLFSGQDLLRAPVTQLRRIWGAQISYLPQDTSTALNPALRVGNQIVEPLLVHTRHSRSTARRRALELLERVGIPDPSAAFRRYPHQFSGGQQQRIALAIGIACDPDIIILDEPTTGLDVTTQARVNQLIVDLCSDTRAATIYISHNLTLLATMCDELAIMYAGQVVEFGPAQEVYWRPQHPYTSALIRAVAHVGATHRPRGIAGLPPSEVRYESCPFHERCRFAIAACLRPTSLLATRAGRLVRCSRVDEIGPQLLNEMVEDSIPEESLVNECAEEELIRVEGLHFTYQQAKSRIVAVDDVSFTVNTGQILGIAGESGSGKSTVLRALAGLLTASRGQIHYRGQLLAGNVPERSLAQRRGIQLVFQNPDATLNPMHTVGKILLRPLALFRPELTKAQRAQVCAEVLLDLHLSPELMRSHPGGLSGGQRQRVALARALVANPDVILCDEVTSALDVSVQASIIEVLLELRKERRTSMVFVTHDLGVLRAIADDIIVMRDGRIREARPSEQVLLTPYDAYTRKLLDSVPDPHVSLRTPIETRMEVDV